MCQLMYMYYVLLHTITVIQHNIYKYLPTESEICQLGTPAVLEIRQECIELKESV